MNTPEIEKLYKGLLICLDINSHIAESSACMVRLPKTVKEGFILAYKLMQHAKQTDNVVFLNEVYGLANKLVPNKDMVSPAMFNKLKRLQRKFNKDIDMWNYMLVTTNVIKSKSRAK